MAADVANFTKLKDACLPHLTSDNLRARKKGTHVYQNHFVTSNFLK
jgi:hypothetical protein